jgi:hypothetical protein
VEFRTRCPYSIMPQLIRRMDGENKHGQAKAILEALLIPEEPGPSAVRARSSCRKCSVKSDACAPLSAHSLPDWPSGRRDQDDLLGC